MLNSPDEAISLLKQLGASTRLIKHLELVGQAGDQVISKLEELEIKFDKSFVQLGISIHDAGKIIHPEELSKGGNLHEAAGENLLLKHGVDERLARCCQSHSKYNIISVSFEELLIALSDKLWKGKRESDLELRIIDGAAAILRTDRWSLFETLDSCFEEIASTGDTRLSHSI